MIIKDEIEQKAKKFQIHEANVQRDYVFGWFLFGVFTISGLKDIIFLKGGNALRKGYFENTRFSPDLDFGIPDDIDQDILLKEINKICDFIHQQTGVDFVKENNSVEEKFTANTSPLPDLRAYEAHIYFKDFYGNADHIKIKISMDITRFDKVILPLQSVNLIHPYPDFKDVACEIRCMKLEEIIATKLKCILQRQHVPDLFDFARSIKLLGGTLDKAEVVRALVQKTIFGRNPHVLKEILYKTPLDHFKEYWEKTIVCAKQFTLSAEEAIKIFSSELGSFFHIYPKNEQKQFVYFGADLRTPIMHAARTQTLLKIRYRNEERIVEPYSLKYQQRRDGVKQEYFFAYKLTGGRSGPGIKMFTPTWMKNIENTNKKFSPRYPIELSKAGEMPENPYLFNPNKPIRATHRSSGTRAMRPAYIYQCNSCRKKFYRRKQKSTLKPHKSSSGFQCYGYAVYIGMRH